MKKVQLFEQASVVGDRGHMCMLNTASLQIATHERIHDLHCTNECSHECSPGML